MQRALRRGTRYDSQRRTSTPARERRLMQCPWGVCVPQHGFPQLTDEPIAVKHFSLGEAGACELSAVQAAIVYILYLYLYLYFVEARLLEPRGAATSADSGKVSRWLGGQRRGLKEAQTQDTSNKGVSVDAAAVEDRRGEGSVRRLARVLKCRKDIALGLRGWQYGRERESPPARHGRAP
jgi:hypothetical protein